MNEEDYINVERLHQHTI